MNISSDVIIGVCSTILGTFLGWFLNIMSNNHGKVKISVNNVYSKVYYEDSFVTTGTEKKLVTQKYVGQKPEAVSVCFTLLVTNQKLFSCGINSCRVYIRCNNKREFDIVDLFKNENSINELDYLLNIEGKETKKVQFKQEVQLWGDDIEEIGYDICLDYKVNGKKKIKTCIIVKK